MYKRFIAIILTAVIVMAQLTGCGASGREDRQTDPVQTDPIETTTAPIQTDSAPDNAFANLPDGFKENGAFVVTYEQAALMMNMALGNYGLYMGFDGISSGTPTYSVVTSDDYESLNTWAYISITDENQPVENVCIYTMNQNTEESLKHFSTAISVACTVADPTLSVSDAAELLANAQTVTREDGSAVKIVEHGDFQFILGITEQFTMFYIL